MSRFSCPISDRRDGLTWLTDGWVDGVPRLGWEDTLAYLTIPVILVATQTLSLQLLGSFDAIDDGKEESKNVANALRLLPLMIGWFAMNAPSGLGLYWVFNNILTTASTVTVKKLVEQAELEPEPIMTLAALGPRRRLTSSSLARRAGENQLRASRLARTTLVTVPALVPRCS